MVSEQASPLVRRAAGVQRTSLSRHLGELCGALSRGGHDVTVYTRRDNPDVLPTVRTPAGFRVVNVDAGPARPVPPNVLLQHHPEFSRHLRREWSEQRPDVVHAYFWPSGLAALHARDSLTSLPVAQTFGIPHGHRVRHERRLARDVDLVAATGSHQVSELAQIGAPRSRISVVPHGVDADRFSPDGPRAPKSQRYRLVASGRLDPRDGFDVAIAALRHLPDTELILIGGPVEDVLDRHPEAERLRCAAERLGVDDRVLLTGEISRSVLPALLRSADAVLCTPREEPSGDVTLEAMACGVPVVAAAVGGLTDAVVDGVTGAVVPPLDPPAVAEAVESLLADRDRAECYGHAGRQRVRKRYTWDRVATDALRAYRRVLAAAS